VLHVVINGTRVDLQDGCSVLHALRSVGIHAPALCHDDRIAPPEACWTCLVQVKGLPKLVTACTTALVDGMEIETETPELEQTRRGILEMLVRRYPAHAIRLNPHKPFHREIQA
jgi:NADH dehydrogenase/NADH:ubiquinone oxidoreductase subunit G